MGVVANLVPGTVTVQAGGQGVVLLRIRNTGSIVDRFIVSVVGPSAAWTRVEPPDLSLFPGAEGETRIVFAPPRSSAFAAGTFPFGIRIVPETQPIAATVEEGRVTVQPFTDVGATLVPQTSRGSRVGRHEVIVENRGNAPVAVELAATDPDRLLSFELPNVPSGPDGRARFSVAPADRGFIGLVARPVDTFLRGSQRQLPFTVDVKAGDQPPLQLRGTLNQGPVLPAWLVPLAGLVAVAVVAVVVLPSLVGSGRPQSGGTALAITPTPLITPSPTPVITPSPTPTPVITEPPPVTPKPQTAQDKRITLRNLQLEDPTNDDAKNPTLRVRSDGPGALTVALDVITGGSAGIRVCLDPGDCSRLRAIGDVATFRSEADGTTDWRVTIDVADPSSIPNVDLTITFPAKTPRITFLDEALFGGDPTSGITTVFTAAQGGILSFVADFGGNAATWRSTVRNVTQANTTEWAQNTGNFDTNLNLNPVGLQQGTTYLFEWYGQQSLDGSRINYSATIGWS